MSRTATPAEEAKISEAKVILATVGLKITGLKDGSGGAVIPSKGF